MSLKVKCLRQKKVHLWGGGFTSIYLFKRTGQDKTGGYGDRDTDMLSLFGWRHLLSVENMAVY